MSKIKKEIIHIRDQMDYEARSKKKCPAWRVIASNLGWWKPAYEWDKKWEAKHAASLRRATNRAFEAVKERGF
jgi:hypothetical protein